MNTTLRISALALSVSMAFNSHATTTLFGHINLFNSTGHKIHNSETVLVVNKKIQRIYAGPIKASEATVINDEGKTRVKKYFLPSELSLSLALGGLDSLH